MAPSPSQNGSSCVYFQFSAADDHIRILVFAPFFLSDGTADVWLDFTKLADDVYFGGSVVHVEPGVSPNWYTINTVHQPDESFDTRLYLFDETWNYVEENDDGGIRLSAEIEGPWLEPDMHILVAAYSTGDNGYTDLIVNDCVYGPKESGASHCHTNNSELAPLLWTPSLCFFTFLEEAVLEVNRTEMVIV